ncbi:hypothetical protein M0651_06080 [Paenibacillus sp. MBLB2552]|uniref:Uncharacterized protein n=1 Tax=Paenibacillus mellifer TaxID=2937794 RepID=A0A9X2BSG8_9BACL|nr:hypothetical protein [Paenibacillus mellifer]MCK8486741.1 hypothetical protein [Paenibacillus mellifer]
MSKKIMISLFILANLTSCSNPSLKDSQASEAYTLYNNIFYHQYMNQLSLFSEVLSGLTKEDLNDVDLAYIKGKIEGYSENSGFVFYALSRNDSHSFNLAVPSELRPSMYELIGLTNRMLSLIRNTFDENNKITVAKDNQELILEVIQMCRELNVSSKYIKDEDNRADYERQLQLALIKIEELQSKLEKPRSK